MIETFKESDEVLYPKERIVTVAAPDLDVLKQMAKLNPRHRIRLCAHQTAKDEIHEMIIFSSRVKIASISYGILMVSGLKSWQSLHLVISLI